jgi:hypothetical protein
MPARHNPGVSPFRVQIMDNEIREMGRRCYGYGRWEAPYWFIGPEQGQARNENHDLKLRCKAWLHCGGGELSDCSAFHDFMNQEAGRLITEWHREKIATTPANVEATNVALDGISCKADGLREPTHLPT